VCTTGNQRYDDSDDADDTFSSFSFLYKFTLLYLLIIKHRHPRHHCHHPKVFNSLDDDTYDDAMTVYSFNRQTLCQFRVRPWPLPSVCHFVGAADWFQHGVCRG